MMQEEVHWIKDQLHDHDVVEVVDDHDDDVVCRFEHT
jgi:hypothetical protein